jgi:hypothetical protein
MARARPEKTLADYVAIAICPVLIMALVGSLVFFLLEISYVGQFKGRLQWILFWFVFGSVLIARIAIEQGREYASIFSLALGGAVALVISRFVDSPLIALLLLGVIWWCTDRLTRDSTLIDESEDASGEGLLQRIGLDPVPPVEAPPPSETHRKDSPPGTAAVSIPDPNAVLPHSGRRAHAPGIWVVYFSLAALPLFGVGQLLIPASDEFRRNAAFKMLWLYVASALGLLLTTSFLGLRRYLRQRKLKMPAAMTGAWLLMGASLIVAILAVCLLLPRPNASYSLIQLVDKASSTAQKASQRAILRQGAGKGDGRPLAAPQQQQPAPGQPQEPQNGGQKAAADQPPPPGAAAGKDQPPPAGPKVPPDEPQPGSQPGGQQPSSQPGAGEPAAGKQPANAQPPGGQQPEQKQPDKQENSPEKKPRATADAQRAQPGEQKPADQKPAEQKPAEQKPGEQKAPEQKPAAPPPPAAKPSMLLQAGQFLAGILKWIIYGGLALVGLYFLIRNWSSVLAALQKFLQEFWAFWNNLLGRSPEAPESEADAEAVAPEPPRPFAAFHNPFTTGKAPKASPAELVRYTFDALEAWAFEQQFGRRPEQTPQEFADALGEHVQSISKEARQMAQLYSRLAYANQSPGRDSLDLLERLWRRMSA